MCVCIGWAWHVVYRELYVYIVRIGMRYVGEEKSKSEKTLENCSRRVNGTSLGIPFVWLTTYHSDNSIKSHRSSDDYGQKNIHF